jgi:hypothetical protein
LTAPTVHPVSKHFIGQRDEKELGFLGSGGSRSKIHAHRNAIRENFVFLRELFPGAALGSSVVKILCALSASFR